MNFVDFWTNKNNPSLPKSEYLYNTRHIIVLLLTVISCITLTIIFRKKDEKIKNKLFKIFAWIFLFFEVLSRMVNLIIETDYSIGNIAKIILPMHICSVVVVLIIVAIFTNNKILINFTTICGLLSTLAFLLYPAVGLNRVYMSFTCIYSTFTHMLGFICSILLITLKICKFNFKEIWQTFLCFVIMFCWGGLLNFVIFPGSDYMYMVNDPLGLNLSIPYQIPYLIVIIIYITSFYFIPFLINKIKKVINAKN